VQDDGQAELAAADHHERENDRENVRIERNQCHGSRDHPVVDDQHQPTLPIAVLAKLGDFFLRKRLPPVCGRRAHAASSLSSTPR